MKNAPGLLIVVSLTFNKIATYSDRRGHDAFPVTVCGLFYK